MRDPLEGIAADGSIATGAARSRVPMMFEPVLTAARSALPANGDPSLYLYGSVATGQAVPGQSDVDLLTVGIDPTTAHELGAHLSKQFPGLSRGVEVAPVKATDLYGDSDQAYGTRVFLRHYCLHLTGPDPADGWAAFPADKRAARGFNGDIAQFADRWRAQLHAGEDPRRLGRALARKTLLATAGLVSVHDGIWTTDRLTAAGRWAAIQPKLANDLRALTAWSDSNDLPGTALVQRTLDETVHSIVIAFQTTVGLWA